MWFILQVMHVTPFGLQKITCYGNAVIFNALLIKMFLNAQCINDVNSQNWTEMRMRSWRTWIRIEILFVGENNEEYVQSLQEPREGIRSSRQVSCQG